MKLTVYTGTNCPWCHKVIGELTKTNHVIRIVHIKHNQKALKFLQEKGLNTVPQVFIQDELHIGGYEDTIEWLKTRNEYKEAT